MMRRGKREAVTCHLCAKIWTAPIGQGRESYNDHYRTEHYVELESERGTR